MISAHRRKPIDVVMWDDFKEEVQAQNYHSSPQYNETYFQLTTYRVSNEETVRSAIDYNIFRVLKKLQGVVDPEGFFGADSDIDVVGEPDRIFLST